MLNSEEIKPIALAIIKLRLLEDISWSINHSVSHLLKILLNNKFSKFHIAVVERFMVDLKTFLSLVGYAYPITPRCDIWGKKSLTFYFIFFIY